MIKLAKGAHVNAKKCICVIISALGIFSAADAYAQTGMVWLKCDIGYGGNHVPSFLTIDAWNNRVGNYNPETSEMAWYAWANFSPNLVKFGDSIGASKFQTTIDKITLTIVVSGDFSGQGSCRKIASPPAVKVAAPQVVPPPPQPVTASRPEPEQNGQDDDAVLDCLAECRSQDSQCKSQYQYAKCPGTGLPWAPGFAAHQACANQVPEGRRQCDEQAQRCGDQCRLSSRGR